MLDVNNFEYMKIGLASPKRFVLGPAEKSKNRRRLTIVRLNRKKKDYFARKFSDLRKTGNVIAVSTNVYAIKVLSVTVVE